MPVSMIRPIEQQLAVTQRNEELEAQVDAALSNPSSWQSAAKAALQKYFIGDLRAFLAVEDGASKVIRQHQYDGSFILKCHLAGIARIGITPYLEDRVTLRCACVEFHAQGCAKVEDPIGSARDLQMVLQDCYGVMSYVAVAEEGKAQTWLFFDPEMKVTAELTRKFLLAVVNELGVESAHILPMRDNLLTKPGGETNPNAYVHLPFFGGADGYLESKTVFLDSSRQPVALPIEFEYANDEAMMQYLQKASTCTEDKAKKDAVLTKEEVLKEIAKACSGFRDQDGQSCVRVEQMLFRVDSDSFRSYLQYKLVERIDCPMKDRDVKDALEIFHAVAYRSRSRMEAFVRKASDDKGIYLDVGDSAWSQIGVTAEGWDILDHHEVPFRRTNQMREFPLPERGGTLDLLRPFLNCSDDDFHLILLWMLACLGPKMPYPLLILKGEQGTAKTTCAWLLSTLIDPANGKVRSLPTKEQDLAIAARNSHLLIFDNLSGMKASMSNALCLMATGGAFACRKLYANDEETILTFQNPVILTGISNTGEREDLLDRVVTINMLPIPDDKRKSMQQVQAEFDAVKGRIFGALLDTVAGGLARVGEVQLTEKTRMADFCCFAEACGLTMGWPAGKATRLICVMRDTTMIDALLEDPFALAVYRYALANPGGKKTATDLDRELRSQFQDSVGGPGWPKGPKMVSQRLGQIAPLLARVEVKLHHPKKCGAKYLEFKVSDAALTLAQGLEILPPQAS